MGWNIKLQFLVLFLVQNTHTKKINLPSYKTRKQEIFAFERLGPANFCLKKKRGWFINYQNCFTLIFSEVTHLLINQLFQLVSHSCWFDISSLLLLAFVHFHWFTRFPVEADWLKNDFQFSVDGCVDGANCAPINRNLKVGENNKLLEIRNSFINTL